MALFGIIVRMQNKRAEKLEDKTVFRESCKTRHEAIDKNLARGETEFRLLRQALTKHGECLARIDERTERLVRKNGA